MAMGLSLFDIEHYDQRYDTTMSGEQLLAAYVLNQ